MTAAEIMGQHMRVTEHGNTRLRKTLMRTLVGQVCMFMALCTPLTRKYIVFV